MAKRFGDITNGTGGETIEEQLKRGAVEGGQEIVETPQIDVESMTAHDVVAYLNDKGINFKIDLDSNIERWVSNLRMILRVIGDIGVDRIKAAGVSQIVFFPIKGKENHVFWNIISGSVKITAGAEKQDVRNWFEDVIKNNANTNEQQEENQGTEKPKKRQGVEVVLRNYDHDTALEKTAFILRKYGRAISVEVLQQKLEEDYEIKVDKTIATDLFNEVITRRLDKAGVDAIKPDLPESEKPLEDIEKRIQNVTSLQELISVLKNVNKVPTPGGETISVDRLINIFEYFEPLIVSNSPDKFSDKTVDLFRELIKILQKIDHKVLNSKIDDFFGGYIDQLFEYLRKIAIEIVEAFEKRGAILQKTTLEMSVFDYYGFSQYEFEDGKPEDLIAKLKSRLVEEGHLKPEAKTNNIEIDPLNIEYAVGMVRRFESGDSGGLDFPSYPRTSSELRVLRMFGIRSEEAQSEPVESTIAKLKARLIEMGKLPPEKEASEGEKSEKPKPEKRFIPEEIETRVSQVKSLGELAAVLEEVKEIPIEGRMIVTYRLANELRGLEKDLIDGILIEYGRLLINDFLVRNGTWFRPVGEVKRKLSELFRNYGDDFFPEEKESPLPELPPLKPKETTDDLSTFSLRRLKGSILIDTLMGWGFDDGLNPSKMSKHQIDLLRSFLLVPEFKMFSEEEIRNSSPEELTRKVREFISERKETEPTHFSAPKTPTPEPVAPIPAEKSKKPVLTPEPEIVAIPQSPERESRETKTFSTNFIEERVKHLLESKEAKKKIKRIIKDPEAVGDGNEIRLNMEVNAEIEIKVGPLKKKINRDVEIKTTFGNSIGGVVIKDIKINAGNAVYNTAVEFLIKPFIGRISGMLEDYIEKEEGRMLEKIEIVDGQLKVTFKIPKSTTKTVAPATSPAPKLSVERTIAPATAEKPKKPETVTAEPEMVETTHPEISEEIINMSRETIEGIEKGTTHPSHIRIIVRELRRYGFREQNILNDKDLIVQIKLFLKSKERKILRGDDKKPKKPAFGQDVLDGLERELREREGDLRKSGERADRIEEELRRVEEGLKPKKPEPKEELKSPESKEEEAERVAKEVAEQLANNPAVIDVAKTAAKNEGVEDEEIESESFLTRVKDRIKDFLYKARPVSGWRGSFKEAIAGGVVGGAIRYPIRFLLKEGLATLGGSIGIGALAGALAGGAVGWGRELYHQKRTVTAGNILEKLSADTSVSEKAGIIARAKDAYDKRHILGSKEEIEEIKKAIEREKKLLEEKIQSEAGVSELKDKSEKDKILGVLKIAEGARKRSLDKTIRKDALELIRSIEFEKMTVDKRKIVLAAVRGALVGALGGAIGGAIAYGIQEYISGMSGAVKDTLSLEPPKSFSPMGTDALAAEAEGKIAGALEVAEAAAKKVIEQGQQDITEKYFEIAVERGEGLTHVARRAIHDYLFNENKLNPIGWKLSAEQLVYAEDALAKELAKGRQSTILRVGESFNVNGKVIEEALSKMLSLSGEKLESVSQLLQDPEHLLSDQTRASMIDFSKPYVSANNFAQEVVSQARQAAKEAVKTALVPSVEDLTQPPTPGTNAVLENISQGEEFKLFAGQELSEQTNQNFQIFSGEELSENLAESFSPIEEVAAVVKESGVEQNLSLKSVTKAIEELVINSKTPGAHTLEHFTDERAQDILDFVSKNRNYSIPGKSLLDKESYIENIRELFGKNKNPLLGRLIGALEHSRDYSISVEHFKSMVKGWGFSENGFNEVAEKKAAKFIKQFGGEKVGFFRRIGLSDQEIISRQKLAGAMKTMLGNQNINISRFSVEKFIKFFV
ncbi:MAG: hypothetical protein WC705_03345 [Candidatus Paceibacterota bacterium]|jgi:hypothetical protein